MGLRDDFARFEHDGWERAANKYDTVWSSLTRQFIPHLVNDAGVRSGMSVLDVACGPGYVAQYVKTLGAIPIGIDFSEAMVAIAKQLFPDIDFLRGDAQNLPCDGGSFDRVLINFGLLHVAHPEQACAEACRVLKPGGKFGFTVWAGPSQNPGAKIVNDAIEAHADPNVELPEGPPHYLYGDKEECREVLAQAGFNGATVSFRTQLIAWRLPSASFLFEAESEAGVRTTGLLKRQSPERLKAIRRAIEEGVQQYAKNGGFALPFAAHIIGVSRD